MPDLTQPSMLPAWVRSIVANPSMFVPVAIVSLVVVIIVPLPPVVMDMLIAGNLALAAVVLLTTVYIHSALDFSVFPSLLLVTTLFRLVLNVASTRLILSAEASAPADVTGVAGEVIEAFGHFVAGGSVVVGIIIFVILIVVQFVVITKGATRISEVAARFTLDAMPGKQMAIDADLNAGVINEVEAKLRREEISREAEFYGAMDGASKFVRGDAVAGIIITVINILGGFAIGVMQKGWPAGETLESFTKLTIGDGLVSQIPSFIIAIAAGLIVTRSSSKADLGKELTGQLTAEPIALGMTGGFLTLLAFTGLPAAPMLLLGAAFGGLAWMSSSRGPVAKAKAAEEAEAAQKQKAAEPEQTPVEKLLNVDTLRLEIGYALVRLVDAKQGGDLLERIKKIRRELAVELGIVVPPIRINDNMHLQPNDYHVKLRGNSISTGLVYPGKFLAVDTGVVTEAIEGAKTREPAFGQDAWWIEPETRQRAETYNYLVVDSTSVLATHLSEIIKNHADELLTREETNGLLEQLKEKSPKLVSEVIGDQVKTGELQKVLQNLLRERVPVRDLETIVETLGDWSTRTKDVDVLTEYTRNALRRTICATYTETDAETGKGRLYCVTLDPQLEDLVGGYIDRGQGGTTMTMPPAVANKITTAVLGELQKLLAAGHHPLVLASPQVRAQVRALLEPHLPSVAVMGYNEVSRGVEVESMGLVQVNLGSGGGGNGSATSESGNRLQGVAH